MTVTQFIEFILTCKPSKCGVRVDTEGYDNIKSAKQTEVGTIILRLERRETEDRRKRE